MLCWLMLGTIAHWKIGRLVPEWLAELSCVRFPLKWVCRILAGDQHISESVEHEAPVGSRSKHRFDAKQPALGECSPASRSPRADCS